MVIPNLLTITKKIKMGTILADQQLLVVILVVEVIVALITLKIITVRMDLADQMKKADQMNRLVDRVKKVMRPTTILGNLAAQVEPLTIALTIQVEPLQVVQVLVVGLVIALHQIKQKVVRIKNLMP